MDSIELLRMAFRDLHKELEEDTRDVDAETLLWQPAPGANHVGFLLWHIVRDEDTVFSASVLKRPELWARGGWAERLGIATAEQGTGLEGDRLGEIRYRLADLFDYAREVWAQTDSALASMDAGRLDEALPWESDWRLANLLTTGCLSHSWSHLGEIRQVRGLRGWRARE